MESGPKSWSRYVDKMTSTGGKPQAKFSRFRNLMAHGQFTPNHFGLSKAPLRIKLINDLTDATLDALDDRFSAFVRKL